METFVEDKIILGLIIMGKGMVGIFAVILVIMIGVMLMNGVMASKK